MDWGSQQKKSINTILSLALASVGKEDNTNTITNTVTNTIIDLGIFYKMALLKAGQSGECTSFIVRSKVLTDTLNKLVVSYDEGDKVRSRKCKNSFRFAT